ncbi:MAG TPA: Plug domain-containing protein [Burkholderiaceae bacterium]|nr:Plug domain-containing protein [Burkholderiaceae bacterium]
MARRKFDASHAVSTLSPSDIDRLAPLNVADLLGQVPGVQAEATGGEAQNIYRVRGIPNESNFFTFQEDGMLVYGENDGFFFKGDVMVRPDLMTQSVEVVRGGPAPLFADNAAAIFNLITRQGGELDERGRDSPWATPACTASTASRPASWLTGRTTPSGAFIVSTGAIATTAFRATRVGNCD